MMEYVQNEIHKAQKILDVTCGNKIGSENTDRCCPQMQYVQYIYSHQQYECTKCGNIVEIQVKKSIAFRILPIFFQTIAIP